MIQKLRLKGLFLRSAVARRVFFLFVLSAFVPVAILALLSYRQVNQVVSEAAQRQMKQIASAQGRAIYDRLLGAGFILSAEAAQMHHSAQESANKPTSLQGVFQRVYHVIDGQASVRRGPALLVPVPQLDAVAMAQLGKAEVALLPMALQASGASLWMAIAVDPEHPERDMLMAELDPTYVWGEPDELPYQIGLCVLGGGATVLYCSDHQLGTVARATESSGQDGKVTTIDGWLVGNHPMFLKPKFAQPDWRVLTLRPDALAAESFNQLGQALWGILLLTLLLVALLSVVQIRRTMVPLERLISGTRRLAREDFDHPVQVTRDDEFGQLADSLNGMASRLSSQLRAMRALSEIDQQILSHLDIGQIVQLVQRRVLDILPSALVVVVVPDGEASSWGTVYLCRSQDAQSRQRRESLEGLDLASFLAFRHGAWLAADDPSLQPVLGMSGGLEVSQAYVFPIIAQEQVVGIMAIGVQGAPDTRPGVLEQIHDLGGRVGVALAAHQHDTQLVFLAHHDGLTGLPNRLFMSERLQQELAYARRHRTQLAILFIDLDRFKSINDTLGHDVGDQLLCQVAQRLSANVRDCDTVARLGGDEFVILQTGLQTPQHAAKLAETLLQVLAQAFQIAGGESFVGGSIGIAVFPDDGQCAEDLLKHGDIAMYRAKAAGRGRMVFFEESMNLELRERALLEQELHQAIARNQLSVHYQPRCRLKDGQLTGAEALVRWQHPELGWVSPARFIPLAEDNGLIDQIGPWVLQQVCQQIALWRTAGLAVGTVAVNVSGRQLRATQLVDQVRDALETAGLEPSALELEVTESVLINDVELVISLLNQLKQTGISLALDDFGTGYSSMAYLKRLPIHVLKIDQSFVRDLNQDEGSQNIVQAIIALAHALNKSVVAEGVETQMQADLLSAWGCEEVQGFYFGRPMTAQAFEARLRQTD